MIHIQNHVTTISSESIKNDNQVRNQSKFQLTTNTSFGSVIKFKLLYTNKHIINELMKL